MPITVAELQRLMRDPNTPEEQIRQYFKANPSTSRPFAPSIIPDPAKVTVAAPSDAAEGQVLSDWANSLARLRRQDIFRDRLARGDRRAVLVSEGDSWFQFPIFLEDVIDQLAARYNIWSVDAAGDTLQNMVLDNAEYMQALRRNAGSVKAFLFSGAGNDVIGEDADGRPVLAKLLRPYQVGKPASWYLDTEALARTLRFIEDCYRKVLTNVAAEFPSLPVLCHGYDYAIPGGQPGDTRNPAWAAQDRWLGKTLVRSLGIRDGALQREIIKLLIDRLNDRIRGLCGANVPGGAFRTAWHVDARGSVGQISMWADELHPTDQGFSRVAARFAAVLTEAVPAHEAAAEGAVVAISPERPAVHPGDDADVDPSERAGDWQVPALEASAWRLAKSLVRLREQINTRFPTRKKTEDGSIGDAAHASRNSDHNPWVRDGGMGVVTAIDVTHDPTTGCTGDFLADTIRASRDSRVKYIIWNRRICSSSSIGGAPAWSWRPYNGANPHNKHIHISVKSDKPSYDDTSDWTLAAQETAVSPAASRPVLALKSVSNPQVRTALGGLEAEAAAAPPVRLVTPGAGGAAGERSRSLERIVVKGKGDPIERRLSRGALETVFGVDDRVRILDTELDPWRMICSLRMQGANGAAIGTGWFVGPRSILTAGHCVFSNHFFGGWAERIEIIPGRDGSRMPYGTLTSTRFSSVDRWIEQEDPDFDIGCIHLDAAPADNLGWFAVASLPGSELQGYLVNVAGYPGDRDMGVNLYHHKNRVLSVGDRRMFYDVDTYGGQSGAPVWIHETANSPPVAVGIHAYGVGGSPAGLMANSAPRIIPEVFDQITAWVKADGGWPTA